MGGGCRQITAIYDNRWNEGVNPRRNTAAAGGQPMERSGRIQLRVTSGEKDQFTTKAAAAGLGLSEYLRKAALDIGLVHRYDQAAVHQLRKIGVNLNQIAYHLNAGNDLEGDVLVALRRCLVKLEKEIDLRQRPEKVGEVPGPAAA